MSLGAIGNHPLGALPVLARHRSVAPEVANLRARIGSWREPALLGGAARFGKPGRWSILAARPRQTFESISGRGFRISTGDSGVLTKGDGLDGLRAWLQRWELDRPDPLDWNESVPFLGGAIGFLSYDLAPRIEKIPRRHDPDSSVPAIRFSLYDTFVLIDHERDEATLWAVDLLREGERAVVARLDDWSRDLAQPVVCSPQPRAPGPVVAEQTRAEYQARVERAKRYIEAGDIFQVNLAQRFRAAGPIDPLELDRRLQASSPAPYSAFLRWGDMAILSASPELFFDTIGREIRTRPIKGTRPRADDPRLDAALRADLIASPKDEAELTMIIDLQRNDLGRVCEFGSVQVVEARAVESYQNVHHTVATVAGRLRLDAGPTDIIRAMFPGGSITGAPKIRAMQIIDELEPCRRGIYTGSIGYWSAHGRSAFNIAIRTLVVEGTRTQYHVGGGIVADSDPASEYQETLDKGRNLFATLSRLGREP